MKMTRIATRKLRQGNEMHGLMGIVFWVCLARRLVVKVVSAARCTDCASISTNGALFVLMSRWVLCFMSCRTFLSKLRTSMSSSTFILR